ncbi:MAG: DUF1559 domain-containing protein, partial [Planctomycetota bacterium]|nr:DUF1559 domain-containing protein [Planctomycetota bacterium]MDA1214111.1 DUF1559 domain-containing protein [Planctomycetota bacterium]
TPDGTGMSFFLQGSRRNCRMNHNFNEHYASVYNSDVLNQRVSAYLCPSMLIPRNVPEINCNISGRPEVGAPSSYLLNEGTGSYQFPNTGMFPLVLPSNGFPNACTRFRDITDGTSNTLAAGETTWNFKNYRWGASACPGSPSHNGTPRWGTARWGIGYPNSGVGNTGSVMNNFSGSPAGYSSLHEGGIHILMADGATRFISENIDFGVYNSLSTKAGQEVIGEF